MFKTKRVSFKRFSEDVVTEHAYKWLPVIREDCCSGCGLCVAACGPACLETENLIAILKSPQDCGSEEHCVGACPEEAIYMAWLPCEGDDSIGVWRSSEKMALASAKKLK
jgi:ferredoxin